MRVSEQLAALANEEELPKEQLGILGLTSIKYLLRKASQDLDEQENEIYVWRERCEKAEANLAKKQEWLDCANQLLKNSEKRAERYREALQIIANRGSMPYVPSQANSVTAIALNALAQDASPELCPHGNSIKLKCKLCPDEQDALQNNEDQK